MSTSKAGYRKSANFTQQDLELAWKNLETLAANEKSNSPPAMNSMNETSFSEKYKKKTAWKNQTVTTTDTGDGGRKPQAVLPGTPRKVGFFEQKDETPTGRDNDFDKKREKYKELQNEKPKSPRVKVNILPASMKNSSPKASPASTPRGTPGGTPRDAIDSGTGVTGRIASARKMKKEVSKKFSKLALNLAGTLGELSPKKESPTSSPAFVGRESPTKLSPRKQRKDWSAEFTNEVCNHATKMILQFNKNDDFKKCSPARQNLLIHAKLMEMLEQKGIPCDLKKLELLSEEVKKRSANAVVDVEIDVMKEPYLQWTEELKRFLNENFGLKTDQGKLYDAAPAEQKKAMELHFAPYFLRDFSGGCIRLECESDDGVVKNFTSLEELADFLNTGDKESKQAIALGSSDLGKEQGLFTRSKYITHFTSQNLTGYMGKLAFGLAPGLPMHIKLHDGTEIKPAGAVTIRYRFKKTSGGGVEVQVFYEMKPELGREARTKEGKYVAIDRDAILTINLSLHFSSDRDLQTSSLRLHAEGWNLTVPDKFGYLHQTKD